MTLQKNLFLPLEGCCDFGKEHLSHTLDFPLTPTVECEQPWSQWCFPLYPTLPNPPAAPPPLFQKSSYDHNSSNRDMQLIELDGTEGVKVRKEGTGRESGMRSENGKGEGVRGTLRKSKKEGHEVGGKEE